MIRNYHNHKMQTTRWHCKEERHNNHGTPGRQTKQTYSFVIFKRVWTPLRPLDLLTQMYFNVIFQNTSKGV